jgi:hypothetical protein
MQKIDHETIFHTRSYSIPPRIEVLGYPLLNLMEYKLGRALQYIIATLKFFM